MVVSHWTRRARFTPLVLCTAAASAGLLAMSVTGTLASFTASITNDGNTLGSATLVLKESDGVHDCISSISDSVTSCTSINKLGGASVLPGAAAVTRTITLTNLGDAPATGFTLRPTACASTVVDTGVARAATGDLCSVVQLSIKETTGGTTTPLWPASGTDSLSNLVAAKSAGGLDLHSLAPGASRTFTFTSQIPSSVTSNAYQGLQASMPLVWTVTG